MDDKDVILLLTWCVDPKGMSFTVLHNVEERIQQYYETLDYYLEKTNLDIVVVENTLFNIAEKYRSNNRIEYLTFDGNNFNKSIGKGFGEALILKYALSNSIFLHRESCAIVKITGRLKIVSFIEHLKQLSELKTKNVVLADANWKGDFVYSYFFIANSKFFDNFFLPLVNNINDSKGIYFEHVLMQAIREYKRSGNIFRLLEKKILIDGISGSTGRTYNNSQNLLLKIGFYMKKLFLKRLEK